MGILLQILWIEVAETAYAGLLTAYLKGNWFSVTATAHGDNVMHRA